MTASRDVVAVAAGAAAGVLAWHRLQAYLRRSDADYLLPDEAHPLALEAPTHGAPSDDAQPPSLEDQSDQVLALLARYSPTVVEGMDPALHYLAPHVPKTKWTGLGDLVAARERCTSGSVDGARWLSLRLDGCGFSKAVRSLRSKGILEARGFSAIFADAMVSGLRVLMEHFHATIGYTQSDEMVVFIAPASIVRGEQQPHIRSGRVAKLATLASGLLTAHFLMQLSAQCLKAGVGLEELAQVLPHFDCRVASYSSWEEARSLLLWRANDCAVNGVSDAVYVPHQGLRQGDPVPRQAREGCVAVGERPPAAATPPGVRVGPGQGSPRGDGAQPEGRHGSAHAALRHRARRRSCARACTDRHPLPKG